MGEPRGANQSQSEADVDAAFQNSGAWGQAKSTATNSFLLRGYQIDSIPIRHWDRLLRWFTWAAVAPCWLFIVIMLGTAIIREHAWKLLPGAGIMILFLSYLLLTQFFPSRIWKLVAIIFYGALIGVSYQLAYLDTRRPPEVHLMAVIGLVIGCYCLLCLAVKYILGWAAKRSVRLPIGLWDRMGGPFPDGKLKRFLENMQDPAIQLEFEYLLFGPSASGGPDDGSHDPTAS